MKKLKLTKNLTAVVLLALVGGMAYIFSERSEIDDVNEKFVKSSFRITSESSGGTAFFVTDDQGIIRAITAKHVCEGMVEDPSIFIEVHGYPIPVKIKRMSLTDDLCELNYPPYVLPLVTPLNLASDFVKYFERNYVGGFPGNSNLIVNSGYYSGIQNVAYPITVGSVKECEDKKGEIALTIFGPMCIKTDNMPSTTTKVYPGHSGSATVDKNGDVIGVAVMTSTPQYSGIFVGLVELRSFLNE